MRINFRDFPVDLNDAMAWHAPYKIHSIGTDWLHLCTSAQTKPCKNRICINQEILIPKETRQLHISMEEIQIYTMLVI